MDQINKRGEIVPELHLPTRRRWRFPCTCGCKFWRTRNYFKHYALYHIVLGDYPL